MLPLNPGSLTRRSNYERGPRAAHEMADGPGPIGFIFHRSSLKPVNFDGDSSTPANNTKLVVHSDKSSPERLAVRFVPVEGFGHFGYIEHVPSGKIVHPRGGSLDPWNNTKLVYRSDRHAGALFAFDEENERIMHRGGKIWQPRGGSPNPGDDTRCVLHSDVHDAAKFYFGKLDGTPISPYPTPKLCGTWKMIKAVINPAASHEFQQRYKVGKSFSSSKTQRHAWNVFVGFAREVFSANAAYSGFVEISSAKTWSMEYEEITTIKVQRGQTVVVWQYVFGMQQYGEEYSFQSSIIGYTNSLNEKPSF